MARRVASGIVCGTLTALSLVACGESSRRDVSSGHGDAGGVSGAPTGGSGATGGRGGTATTGGSTSTGGRGGASVTGGASGDGGTSGDAGAGAAGEGGAGDPRCEPGEVRCLSERERCSDDGVWQPENFVCATDVEGSTEFQMACAVKADGRLRCFGPGSNGDFFANEYNEGVPPRAVVDVDVADELGGLYGVCAREADAYVTCWGVGNTNHFDYGGGFVRVATSAYGLCGILRDGELACPTGGVTRPPEPGPYVELDSSNENLWALHVDGSVHGGTREFPPGSYRRIAAGGNQACAITSGGTIVCDPEPALPDELASDEFVELAVEYFARVCAIRVDGTLACFGGRDGYEPFFAPPGRFTRITPVTGGMCAIRADGAIQCFGEAPLIPPEGY